jgi:multidrug efflux pump subunit AcrA (membrane-fusion protein)
VSERYNRPWLNYLLGLLCIGAIVIAYLSVSPASQSAAASRTVAAAKGVVQSTVSGSGNIQAASQLDLGFKTSGVVTHIYVKQGQYVTTGRLLATLDPESAEVTLEQAKANLQSAEASLTETEEDGGESSSDQSSSNSQAVARTAAVDDPTQTATPTASTSAQTPTGTPTTPTTTTAPVQTEPQSTTPATTTPTATSPAVTRKQTTTVANGVQPTQTQTSSSTETQAPSTPKSTSAATKAANIASARAAVKSDRLTVQSAEEAVQNTKLYAPEDGTIVSLTGEVGETVSGGGTTKASSSSSASSSTSGGGSATGSAGTASTGGSASSSTSSSSSSSFAVLSDLSSMELVVPLSESEVGSVRDGQPATVTVEALASHKLAAHVESVATLSTTSSSVVSYDVTFGLDQSESGLKPGMSASAEVVVKQAEGVNVPTSAITGESVTVIRGGKQERKVVTTGLAGNSSTIVLTGLKAGEEVALPAASTTSSSSSLLSRLAGRSTGGTLGGAGLGGGGFTGGGAGFGGGGFSRRGGAGPGG